MRSKKLNAYSKNENGTVNIHLNDKDVVVIDAVDIIKCKPFTVVKRVYSTKYSYPIISRNRRQPGGAWKVTHSTVGKFLTGADVTRYEDGNPFNCTRANLRALNSGKKNAKR